MASKVVERRFAGAVGAVKRSGGMQRICRGHVDDPTPALIDHSADESPGGQVVADHVDHQRLDPFVRIAVLDELDRPEGPGRVDQDGRRSYAIGGRDDVVERARIAQVCLHHLGAPSFFADAACCRRRSRLAAGDKHQRGAMGREPNSGALTETPARPGDHGDLSTKVGHRVAPAFVSRWKTSRRVLESTIPSSRKNISGFIASSDHLSWILVRQSLSHAFSSMISEYRKRTGSFSNMVIVATPLFSISATSSGQMLS